MAYVYPLKAWINHNEELELNVYVLKEICLI